MATSPFVVAEGESDLSVGDLLLWVTSHVGVEGSSPESLYLAEGGHHGVTYHVGDREVEEIHLGKGVILDEAVDHRVEMVNVCCRDHFFVESSLVALIRNLNPCVEEGVLGLVCTQMGEDPVFLALVNSPVAL